MEGEEGTKGRLKSSGKEGRARTSFERVPLKTLRRHGGTQARARRPGRDRPGRAHSQAAEAVGRTPLTTQVTAGDATGAARGREAASALAGGGERKVPPGQLGKLRPEEA